MWSLTTSTEALKFAREQLKPTTRSLRFRGPQNRRMGPTRQPLPIIDLTAELLPPFFALRDFPDPRIAVQNQLAHMQRRLLELGSGGGKYLPSSDVFT